MKILTDKTLNEAIKLCYKNENYRVLIVTKYAEDHMTMLDYLLQVGTEVTRCFGHPWAKFPNGSIINMISSDDNLRGRKANLVLCETDVYNDYEEIRYILPFIEIRNRDFVGRRADLGVYDDAWVRDYD